jgi:hypothetical protein
MYIQFIAQNKRRCYTGSSEKEAEMRHDFAPQASLFQHVPVKRLHGLGGDSSTQYRLSSHEDADVDGTATRFICHFSNGEETLSIFNFSYEWTSRKRRLREMFHEHGRDNKKMFTSQLLFKCPVPSSLVEAIRTGSTIQNDYATLYVDLVPIRTPPRYGQPAEFLPPYYKDFQLGHDSPFAFDPTKEWGNNHILPKVKNSGRWANIPICKPTPLTYEEEKNEKKQIENAFTEKKTKKKHRLVSCLWTSTGYSTRGDKFAIDDGQKRLVEWIAYHKLIGMEHFYLYDNSGAFTMETSLQPIADLFPNEVTYVKWPSHICNNNEDTVGERSSQYAAEASCRLRFGPGTDWIAQVKGVDFILDCFLPRKKITYNVFEQLVLSSLILMNI